jgi:hypothetical protein
MPTQKPSTAIDLIELQDERKTNTTSFTLWPRTWNQYTSTYCNGWQIVRLHAASKAAIPASPGIYTMLIQPGIATHPAASFLMYVGQTQDLADRFDQYLTVERRPEGRPKVVRLLHKYEHHLWFCFCQVALPDLDPAENALINAYDPPCNEAVEAELRAARKAF